MQQLNQPRHENTTNWGSSDTILNSADIVGAMEDQFTVEFDYDDKHRIVEFHAVGTSTKDGSIVARGYQVGGEASRPLPQWTLFTVSKMQNVKVTTDVSEAPREGYAQGDKQMASILAEIAL